MPTALAFGLLLLAGVACWPNVAFANSNDRDLSSLLDEVRRSLAASNDPAVIENLAHQADAAPPGYARAEARMLVAEAWLGRMRRTEDALRLLRLVAEDPEADSLTRRLAEREIVDTWIGQGRIRDAASEVRRHPDRLDSRFARQVVRLERREGLRIASLAELSLFGVLVALGLAREKGRGFRKAIAALRGPGPIILAFCTYVALVGGALATQFEAGSAGPFVWLGLVTAPILLLARAWAAVGSPSRGARIGRAFLCGASALAAAFLLLATSSPMYLEGFGL